MLRTYPRSVGAVQMNSAVFMVIVGLAMAQTTLAPKPPADGVGETLAVLRSLFPMSAIGCVVIAAILTSVFSRFGTSASTQHLRSVNSQ